MLACEAAASYRNNTFNNVIILTNYKKKEKKGL
jgi:hypothetical protein